MTAALAAVPAVLAQAPSPQAILLAQPTTLREIRPVLEKIPNCSELLRQSPATGKETVFLPAMRKQGIATAHYVIGADTQPPAPRGVRILRVVYFAVYDDPSSEITDPSRLKEIEDTGLAAALRAKALSEGRDLPFIFDSEIAQYPTTERPAAAYTADLELDADTWLRPLDGPYNNPLGGFYPRMPGPMTAEGAVARQDIQALRTAVENSILDQTTLSRLLLLASASVRNSSEVIRMLTRLGADPNQRVRFPAPVDRLRMLPLLPLVVAIHGSACNVAALLSAGANPNLKDGFGHSALEEALQDQRGDIAALLRAAGAVLH